MIGDWVAVWAASVVSVIGRVSMSDPQSQGENKKLKGRPFKVVSEYKPAGDQPTAIAELVDGIESGLTAQTLLGKNSLNSP